MATSENFDLAHLGGVELYTPKFEESLRFFRDILAMREVERIGDSAYLRCWDEYQLYSLKLTATDTNGVGRTLYRASSQEALERRVAAIERSGLGHGWREPEVGVGRSYEFEDPDGHVMALYYDTELYVPGEEDRPALKNQAGAFPGRGVNARRMDHINYLASDVNAAGEFWRDVMCARESERVRLDDGGYGAWWFRFQQKSYDVVYSADWTGERGRFHHFAIAPDSREDVLRAADIFLEEGVHIEFGPYKHSINQTFFIYVWEPGGNRVELANAGARLILDPDWPVVEWSQAERAKGQAWGMKTVPTFHTHGTPFVEDQEEIDAAAMRGEPYGKSDAADLSE